MDDGHKDGVTRKTAGTHFNRERTAVSRTFAEADLAAQPLPGETCIGINYCNTHFGVADILKLRI